MEGPTEKDKLIVALKVSGLSAGLWEIYKFLYSTKDRTLPYDFKERISDILVQITALANSCDNYLDSYVRNFKE